MFEAIQDQNGDTHCDHNQGLGMANLPQGFSCGSNIGACYSFGNDRRPPYPIVGHHRNHIYFSKQVFQSALQAFAVGIKVFCRTCVDEDADGKCITGNGLSYLQNVR
jgi:hypothetical protein